MGSYSKYFGISFLSTAGPQECSQGTGNPAQRILTNPCIYYGNSVVPNVRCCSKQLGCMSEQFATPSVSGCVWVVPQDRFCVFRLNPTRKIYAFCAVLTQVKEKERMERQTSVRSIELGPRD